MRQASGLLDPPPIFPRPVTALDPFPACQQFPRKPGAFECGIVEQIEASVVSQRRFSPPAVGDEHVARLMGRISAPRKEDRLPCIVGPSRQAMGKEAIRALIPQDAVKPGKEALILS